MSDVDGQLSGMTRASRKVDSDPKAFSSESQDILRNQRCAAAASGARARPAQPDTLPRSPPLPLASVQRLASSGTPPVPQSV